MTTRFAYNVCLFCIWYNLCWSSCIAWIRSFFSDL